MHDGALFVPRKANRVSAPFPREKESGRISKHPEPLSQARGVGGEEGGGGRYAGKKSSQIFPPELR